MDTPTMIQVPPAEALKRSGHTVKHKGFPVRRKRIPGTKTDEYQVWMGFKSQAEAYDWIERGLKDGWLAELNGMKSGAPDKPKKAFP